MPEEASNSIHVIYVNYNSASLIQQSIAPLLDCAHIIQFTIIDNNSLVSDRPILEKLAASNKKVHVEYLDLNIGFGAAINYAVATTSPKSNDILWLLNPDTIVPDTTIFKLKNLKIPKGTIGSPIILSARSNSIRDDKIWFVGSRLSTRSGVCRHIGFGRSIRTEITELDTSTDYVTGASMLIRTDDFQRLGGFREELFLYWEDTDLSLRAIDKGFSLTVYPELVIYHLEGGSQQDSEGRSKIFYYYYARNRIIVCAGRIGIRRLMIFGTVETAKIILRAAFQENNDRFGKTFAAIRGTYAGFKALLSVRSKTKENVKSEGVTTK